MFALLQEHVDIFAESKALPSHRIHDHQILLNKGTLTMNVRPYRYHTLQKDFTKTIVKEVLETGMVRSTQSPFSSPIALVKKKEWYLEDVYSLHGVKQAHY